MCVRPVSLSARPHADGSGPAHGTAEETKGSFMGTRYRHDQAQLGLLAGAAAQAEDVRDAWDAARLTQARLLAGLTKQEVAQELGVSPAAVGQWETGVRPPLAEHIAGLARALAVPVAFFRIGRPQVRVNAACAHFR